MWKCEDLNLAGLDAQALCPEDVFLEVSLYFKLSYINTFSYLTFSRLIGLLSGILVRLSMKSSEKPHSFNFLFCIAV